MLDLIDESEGIALVAFFVAALMWVWCSHSNMRRNTAWWTAVAVALMIFMPLAVKYFINFNTPLTFFTPLWMEFVIVGLALFLLLGSTWWFTALARKITRSQATCLADMEPDFIDETAAPRQTVTIVTNA